MKFSYFNTGDNKLGLTTITRGVTSILSTVAPRLSAFLGLNILMRPHGRRSYASELITPENELNMLTSMGTVHVNIFGKGREVIIVSHGWEDTSQSFQQMIISLTEQGYLVAAIDHIGHGKSAGKKSHLLSFIETINLLTEHFNEENTQIKAIIGHSMGAIATLNLPFNVLEHKKIILISSPIKFFELMFQKVEQVGISRKMLKRVLESVSRKYGKTWQQLAAESHREKLTLDITFIHDLNDRFAPFDDVKYFLNQEKNTLIATEGLGHRKILGDTKVIENISQVLAS
jgi:pimeloyl-ACP methyl ester carboxylesterase